MSSRNVVVALLLVLLTTSITIATTLAQPPWAKTGNWAEYEIEGRIATPPQLGSKEVKFRMSFKLTIIEVTDRGFRVRGEVKEFSVEPKEFETFLKSMATSMRKIEERFFEFGRGFSPCEFYVNPVEIPANGVFEGSSGGMSYRCVYDKSTGWIKEARVEGSLMGLPTTFSIKLVNSNFIGGVGGGIPIWLIVTIVVIVVAAVAGFFIALKRRSTRAVAPAPQPQIPSQPQ